MILSVIMRGTNARLGRLIGIVTVVIALAAVSDGFVTVGGVMAIAGAVLYKLESAHNSALFAFVLRVTFLVAILASIGHIIG